MDRKKKNNIIIGSLCAVLLLMVVGYAAFSTTLNIKGISNITSNWDIKITKITSNVLNGNATNASEPTGVNTLTASFETNLVSPGDSMEYVITVTNSGSLDATLEKITMSQPDNEYVTFAASINGETITAGENMTFTETTQTLNAGESKNITVVVTFKDVTISKMEPISSDLTLSLDYAQAGGSGGIVTPSEPNTAEKLIATAVTTGDGLYKDEYEEGRYVYKGANPNNYITFNGENAGWRILSVESDGTLKIMKTKSIGQKEWDITGGTYGSNNWARPADLNTYLNNDYYDSLIEASKNHIQMHSWDVGPIIHENFDLAAQILSEKSVTWNGNIGLISVSDVIRANTNILECGEFNSSNANYNTCKKTNYLWTSVNFWTISSRSTESAYYVNSNVYVASSYVTSKLVDVLPALYLKADITLSGTGTSDDPYTINE